MNTNSVRITMDRRVRSYGTGSMAVTVPKQLGFAVGDTIKVTFETIGQEVKE